MTEYIGGCLQVIIPMATKAKDILRGKGILKVKVILKAKVILREEGALKGKDSLSHLRRDRYENSFYPQ
jgi:hypothetical protein